MEDEEIKKMEYGSNGALGETPEFKVVFSGHPVIRRSMVPCLYRLSIFPGSTR